MANEKQSTTTTNGKAQDKAAAAKKERKPATTKAPTRDDRIAAYRAQDGKCYVTGLQLVPEEIGRSWTVVDGKAVTKEVARQRGGRSWDSYRAFIAAQVKDAQDTLAKYAGIVGADGKVTFHGDATAAAPAAEAQA